MEKIKMSVAETSLEKHVVRWFNEGAKENTLESIWYNLSSGGCESGFVTHLIYTKDTLKFFKKYKKDINSLLCDMLGDRGSDAIADLLPAWDNNDPLAMDLNNQNLLAWFGFEEAARRISERVGLER